MVNPETLQNHIKNVHHKNGQTKPNQNSDSVRKTNPTNQPGQDTAEKQPSNELSGGSLPSSSAIAGLDSRYSLLNYPFFHPGPC